MDQKELGNLTNILGYSAIKINTITGTTANDTIIGTNAADSLVGGAGNDSLSGLGGNDTLRGGAGDDTLNGGSGSDSLIGGIGNDLFYVDNTGDIIVENVNEGTDLVKSSITYTLTENVENLTLTGSSIINGTGNSLDNYIVGNSAVNVLTGGAGNDTLDGGLGADTTIGGTGDDTYYVSNYIDIVVENANEGNDTIYSTVTYTLSSNVENLVLTGTSTMNGTGNELDNFITGNSAANTLTGAAGNDTLDGGDGSDLLTGGAGNDSLYGGDGNDTIRGGAGNDILIGGAGADSLVGGMDNDVYYVDNAGDVVVENANEGFDAINSSVTYTLTENVENLFLTGTNAINGTGNSSDNYIMGNSASNVLLGGAGNDTLDGGVGGNPDTMIGGIGNDAYVVDNINDVIMENPGEGVDTVYSSINYTLSSNVENLTLTGIEYGLSGTGNDLNNVIIGTSSYNIIDGGLGADTMIGGDGMDFYSVDNVGDVIIENANEGRDLVYSSIDYTLGDNVEDLVLEGMAYINGTGNELDNYIGGNVAANVLIGGGGNDTLDARAGSKDTLIGGTGNDTYLIGSKGSITDDIIENEGEGTDTVISSLSSYTLANNVENLILDPISGDISGTGNNLDNVINGNYSNNIIDGELGADTMIGGRGDDIYYVDNAGDVIVENEGEGIDTVRTSNSYILGKNIENLTLAGSEYGTSAVGNDLDNIITGNSSYNMLDGGLGADTMIGGDGMDFYSVDNVGDVIIENANEGTDAVWSAIDYTLSDNVEDLILEGTTAIKGIGNNLNNHIFGNSESNLLMGYDGNDTINSWAGGEDTLVGGTGDDLYVIGNKESITDVIIENANEGIDTVRTLSSYKLADNVENLILDRLAGSIRGIGNDLNNVITGNSSNNLLDGGLGADTMIGGDGDDYYYVDNNSDVVMEYANEGNDTVMYFGNSPMYVLGDNIENLVLEGSSNKGIGNSLNNVITGNAENNLLSGCDGDDTLNGNDGDDILIGGEGNDIINGGVGNDFISGGNNDDMLNGCVGDDTIIGGDGNDILYGGIGADIMFGGLGYDDYYVDNVGDVVLENANEGIDTVISSVSYTLSDNVENLILDPSAGSISGTGNDLDNYIKGNSASNTLTGNAGNDIILGQGGNDLLDGGLGADTMYGGTGEDYYYVDNAGDVVIENANEGMDAVFSSISYTLGDNVEFLLLEGDAISGTGNDLDNYVNGNMADNMLIGNAGNDILWDNSGNDTLDGGAGNDNLRGGTGNDLLIGGEGDDVYEFSSPPHFMGASGSGGIDQIIDAEGNDKIYFFDGVNKSNIAMFMDSNNNLIIDYGTTGGQDIINVQNQAINTIEEVMLNNGEYMTSSDINALIQNMTAYANNNSIEFNCISDVKNNQDLMTMVANSWHS